VRSRRTRCEGLRKARVVGLQGLAATALALSPGAHGALLIDVGTFSVLPNTPGQVLDIYVLNTGPEPVSVAGLSLNVQVGDSGPADRGGLGLLPGPSVASVNILTDALFGGNNTGQVDGAGALQFANARTTTSSGAIDVEVGSPFLLGRVEVDTTGFFFPGSWELRLGNTVNGSTRFFDELGNVIIPTITDGIITAVPEPASAAVAAGLGALLYAAARARKS
jgi:hypothetical protein